MSHWPSRVDVGWERVFLRVENEVVVPERLDSTSCRKKVNGNLRVAPRIGEPE